MKVLVGTFNQEKALVGAFSVITNLCVLCGPSFKVLHRPGVVFLRVLGAARLRPALGARGEHLVRVGARLAQHQRGRGLGLSITAGRGLPGLGRLEQRPEAEAAGGGGGVVEGGGGVAGGGLHHHITLLHAGPGLFLSVLLFTRFI